MKVFVRVISLVLIMTMVFGMLSISFARYDDDPRFTDGGTGSGGSGSSGAGSTSGAISDIYGGNETIPGTGETKIKTIGGKIIGALQVTATVIALATLLMIGMKFLTSSPSEKAIAKTMLTPYIVAVVLMFAAIPILSIIYKVSQL